MAFRVNNFCPVPSTEEAKQNAIHHMEFLRSRDNIEQQNQQPVAPIDMTNSNKFRDVHYYDGQLVEPFIQTRVYSMEEKKTLFQNLVQRLQHPIAIQMVQMISNAIGTSANIDNRNNIDCAEVLAEICTYNLDDELMFFLQEQLVDNHSLGQCPQGRSWRLMQIYRVVKTAQEEKNTVSEIESQLSEIRTLLEQLYSNCSRSINVTDFLKRATHFFLKSDQKERDLLVKTLRESSKTCNTEKLEKLYLQL